MDSQPQALKRRLRQELSGTTKVVPFPRNKRA